MDGGQGQPSSILGSKHIVCWGFEDLLSASEKDGATPSAPANSNLPNNTAQGGAKDKEKGTKFNNFNDIM